MHPYIAYLLITNPANYQARPDECCIGLRELLGTLWHRLLATTAVRRSH